MLRTVTEVSNIPFAPPFAPSVRQAKAEELNQAIGLILGSGNQPASESQVGDFYRLTAQRGIDLSRVQVAAVGEKLIWAVMPIASPGRTLLILSPNSMFDAAQYGSAEQLVRSVCDDYNGRCRLAQVLLDPTAEAVRAVYRRLGFQEMAQLDYLHAPVRRIKSPPVLPPEMEFAAYSPQSHAYFGQAIRESYEQSLDCPALNGLREIEDVIQGHRAAGQVGGDGNFDPLLWRVLLHRPNPPGPPQPCGVLLLCRTDPGDSMELVYLGVSPSVRRRGLATCLLRHALATAAEDKRKRLTLAVDTANAPALQLYYRHGFQKVGVKIALIKVLEDTKPPDFQG
jgi:mycothiol synthase